MSPGDRRPTPGRRRQSGGRPAQGQAQGQAQGERQPGRGARAPWRGGGRTVEEVSAGGIVVETSTGEARAALIARLNRAGRLEWCLPKGHLEGSETPQEAAVREVAEETGITGVVVGELGTIDYWFSAEGRRIHKTVHHYLLEATGGAISVDGDPDAEAVEAAWVPVVQLGQRLAFSNERRIARAASELLASGG